MKLSAACSYILSQLTDLVNQIHEEDFSRPSRALGNSSVGQHLRHTIEFFICFQQGFDAGVINYDKRGHDKLIETDKQLALQALADIHEFVSSLQEDRPLQLEVSYDLSREEFVTIATNAVRELVYNIEHAVHHMAIMKIGVHEVAPYVKLPFDFGVAASTVRYQESVQVR